jgi:hypothetical protein
MERNSTWRARGGRCDRDTDAWRGRAPPSYHTDGPVEPPTSTTPGTGAPGARSSMPGQKPGRMPTRDGQATSDGRTCRHQPGAPFGSLGPEATSSSHQMHLAACPSAQPSVRRSMGRVHCDASWPRKPPVSPQARARAACRWGMPGSPQWPPGPRPAARPTSTSTTPGGPPMPVARVVGWPGVCCPGCSRAACGRRWPCSWRTRRAARPISRRRPARRQLQSPGSALKRPRTGTFKFARRRQGPSRFQRATCRHSLRKTVTGR